MTTTPGEPGRQVDTQSLAARMSQVALAFVIAVLSVVLLVTTHRVRLALGGVDLPAGLLFGTAFQVTACVFLYAATGSRLPLVVLGSLWGLLAMPFLGRGVGGGVLFPAVIGDQVQLSGWIVQGIGVLLPFAMALVITALRRRPGPRPSRRSR
ncbi:hypothetical protein [Brachybacterium muris]|uniref:hypothetical protein n=1 Tax=Brachybacterium muris TaxID=219301 RepID=UPI001ED9B4BA|nr:hypothetical protein [Brachybacterium muris]MCT1654529.1 hypothetical protein [Brachybacterium muris]